MNRREYAFGDSIDLFPSTRGIWEEVEYSTGITWPVFKIIAKRVLTPLQYDIIMMRAKGVTQEDLGAIFGISRQSAVEYLQLSSKKMNKFYKKTLHFDLYSRGGFFQHVRYERKLKRGEYIDRFEKRSCLCNLCQSGV